MSILWAWKNVYKYAVNPRSNWCTPPANINNPQLTSEFTCQDEVLHRCLSSRPTSCGRCSLPYSLSDCQLGRKRPQISSPNRSQRSRIILGHLEDGRGLLHEFLSQVPPRVFIGLYTNMTLSFQKMLGVLSILSAMCSPINALSGRTQASDTAPADSTFLEVYTMQQQETLGRLILDAIRIWHMLPRYCIGTSSSEFSDKTYTKIRALLVR